MNQIGFFLYHLSQERPPKPDIAWLTEQTWNTCCDLEVRLEYF